MSSGTPSSQVLSRWIAPVPRTSTQAGPNGRVPATQSCCAPVTYRTLAPRPKTRTSRSWAAICSSARWRRPDRSVRSSGRTSVAIGVIGVVGQANPAFLGDHQDLFAAIAAGAVFPHHRLQHQHHPGLQNEILVELLPQIGSDHGHFGGIDADTVTQVEVRQPRLGTAVGLDRRPAQIRSGGTGFGHTQDGADDLEPLVELRLLTRRGIPADDPRASEVGAVALVG